MKRFRHYLRIQCVIGLLLGTLLSSPTTLTAAPLPTRLAAAETGQAGQVWRVYLRIPADAITLTRGGWDVLEARGKDAAGATYLLVMGDAAAAAALRAQGFRVELDHAMNARAPLTFNGGYRTVVEHYQHIDDLARLHSTLAVSVTYGVSWRRQQNPLNGYDLRALCITRLQPGDCALTPTSRKPRFFLMAAIHARELTPAELAWRWMDELVNQYGVDADITALLNDSEVWVVPQANPDGRAIVETSNPWQRKNANSNYCSPAAPGADLNRNASFQWGVAGYSPNPCEDVFYGDHPASEPEENALENLMRQLFPAQRGPALTDAAPLTTTGLMLTLHSYSNLVLLPWGYTECFAQLCPPNQRAPNDVALRELAFHMSYFNGYTTGQASEALYAASGTTDDWAYGVLGIPGFTFEVGPMSGLCADFAPPYSCQDDMFWPQNKGAFLYAAKVARLPYALGLGPTVLLPVSTLVVPLGASTTFTAQVTSEQYGSAGYGRPTSRAIQAAEYSIDAPPGVSGTLTYSLSAQDGAFDQTSEGVSGVISSTVTNGLSAGRHLLVVRAQDTAGRWGPPTARWLFVARYTQHLILVYRQ
jgi:hypothetical protein